MAKKGWILPEVIDPPDSYTVCICVPNEIHYIAAFWGALQELGYQHNWERDPAHKALDVSVKWNAIIAAANERSNGMPLSCFTCDELAACIAPLLEEQTQQFGRLLNLSKYGTETTPGTPMTTEERETDLAAGTNPTCNLAILCGQAGGLIKYWIDTVNDILEKAEVATNTAEFLDVVTQITGLDELSADAITGYITFIQDAISEGYAAAVDAAYIEAVKCDLFCQSKEDCIITPDDLYQVFRARVEAITGSPLPAFNTLIDMFQFLFGVPMDSTIIADTMHLIMAGGGVLANVFMGDVGVKPLQLLMALLADEPDNDCELLCDCPEPPAEMVIAEDANTCIPATITGMGSIVFDTGEYWLCSTEPVSGGHAFVIKRADDSDFRYEFDSMITGGTVERVRMDNRNGGPQVCHDYSGVGWQDQNQLLRQLSGAWSAPATVRLRIF